MPKRGGGPLEEATDIGLWGLAYSRSDGSFMGVIKERFLIGLYILLGIIAIGGLGYILFKIFGHVTPAAPVKEPFENEVPNRPMFSF